MITVQDFFADVYWQGEITAARQVSLTANMCCGPKNHVFYYYIYDFFFDEIFTRFMSKIQWVMVFL